MRKRSITFTVSAVVIVHFMQELEAKNRRIGIQRDDEIRSQKRIENELEQKLQLELQEKLTKEQGVQPSFRQQK
ncbi:hypothetical protein EDD86DRAFT_243781 [Gorgonomyces haynaldii]|nr:hypothetical protein EDD86DRAFT_243781 [Gorgonomyces haynaldii]